VIATIWRASLQSGVMCVANGNLTLSVCLQSYLVVWNMIANLLVYFCDCKKEKEN
jgi:hypothetical protein